MKKMFVFVVCAILLSSCNDGSNNNIFSTCFEGTRNLMVTNPREALKKLLNISDKIDSLQHGNPYLKGED